MSTPPRRALITGGAGFIGSHLAEALVARGDQVTAIDDLSTGSLDNIRPLIDAGSAGPGGGSFSFVNETILDEAVLDRLIGEADVIFHLAAAVGVRLIIDDPVGAIETNILGTREVLHLARRYGSKVVVTSTSEVYGKGNQAPYEESADCVLGPTTTTRWSYAASKAIDEILGLAYHRQFDVPVVVVRLFNTVGPRQTGDYGMVVPRFVRQALAGEALTVYGDGAQTRCFCDVRDTVRAIIGLAEEPAAVGQLVNVGSTNEITILDLAHRVLGIVDEAGAVPPAARRDAARTELVPYETAYAEGFEDMRRRVPDIARVRSMIGWEPTIDLEETLRRVVRHELRRRGDGA